MFRFADNIISKKHAEGKKNMKIIYDLYSSDGYYRRDSIAYFSTRELAERCRQEVFKGSGYYAIKEMKIEEINGKWYWPVTEFNDEIIETKNWDETGWRKK